MRHIPFLPLQQINLRYQPALGEALSRVADGGWYLRGKEAEGFEREFAQYVGVAHTVSVANGLDALTLALMAMKIKFGWDEQAEVIVPDMTFVASASAVTRAGLRPVFADVDEHALLTPETAAPVLTDRTRAVLPVHLYGRMCRMPELVEWAGLHGLKVLEDAAQAHGAECAGRRAGSWGTMAAFSFYPGKNLGALGDAGAVTTDDAELASLVRTLANYGAERKYHHLYAGLNSRMDELQAAVLRIKLRTLDADNARRRHVADIYARELHSAAVTVPYGGDTAQSVFHIYPLRTPARAALQAFLAERGIETLIHYPLTVSAQRAFSVNAPTPKAHAWAAEEISLPVSPVLSDDDAVLIAQTLNAFCE